MQFDPHEKARWLIDRRLVAGIAEEDDIWLRSHASVCGECDGYWKLSDRLVRGLHSFSFDADSEMNSRIQNALLARARQVADNRPHDPWRPLRWLTIAAALLLAVAVPVYRDLKNRMNPAEYPGADALLEQVQAHVSRTVPEAMEPLLGPDAPGSTGGKR